MRRIAYKLIHLAPVLRPTSPWVEKPPAKVFRTMNGRPAMRALGTQDKVNDLDILNSLQHVHFQIRKVRGQPKRILCVEPCAVGNIAVG